MSNAWSFTSLTAFETCPWRYYVTRITKEVKEPETEALRWGNEVHKAFETYMTTKGACETPEWFDRWKPIADRLLAKPGDKYAEYEAAITEDFQPCGWWDDVAWCRGKLDVLIINGPTALVFDYKTGKPKLGSDQLRLFALLTFAHFSDVESVRSGYIWLASGQVTTDTYHRQDAATLWPMFIQRVNAMRRALESGTMRKRPSGLCRNWCPVPVALCEYSGKEG